RGVPAVEAGADVDARVVVEVGGHPAADVVEEALRGEGGAAAGALLEALGGVVRHRVAVGLQEVRVFGGIGAAAPRAGFRVPDGEIEDVLHARPIVVV